MSVSCPIRHILIRSPTTAAYEWSRSVQTLLKSGLVQGSSLVGLGHSAGACVLYTISRPLSLLSRISADNFAVCTN